MAAPLPTAAQGSLGPRFQGLDGAEARRRLLEVGPNRLVEVDRWARLRELASLLSDPMALMLGAAGAVYLLMGETRDGVILLAAIAPVLAVDVLLEARSRSALKKLAAAVSPRVRVVRGGVEREVPSEELVPGDLVLLREGDILHADGVVRRAANLVVDESQLTGESEPVAKHPDAGPEEQPPPGASFWAGSLVLTGQGVGQVTSTGPRTRYGKIAHLVARSAPDPTPLQRKTGRLVKRLGLVAALVAGAVFGLGLLRGEDPYRALLTALSVAIAAVPEEFPLVFTIFLSLGAFRLSRRGVLVRRLAAVETLGSTTVICTDKTGTLTAGLFALDARVPLHPAVSEQELLEAAVLACEAQPSDTMERALLAGAAGRGVEAAALHAAWDLVHDHAFDPAGKHMSHVWARRAPGEGDRWRICAKGALEGILEHCQLAPAERERAEQLHAELAAKGMRVLAVAARTAPAASGVRAEDESGLRLLGLLGFRDPLRPEVPAAVAECRRAGIDVKIVTGDHLLTAHAIAEAAGVPHVDGSGMLTGSELDALPLQGLPDRLRRVAIFARVRPEQKHAIVDALARAGEVVAMTGDGINDAPALRRADIGISYGVRGTQVARAAADLVLLKDDFAAIVATIREGRGIFANIQKAFLYLLSFKLRVVGLALLVPLAGLPAFFQPVHLVWLELIIHPVSALVFEAEPPPADVMLRPPRDPRAPLVERRLVIRSLLSGLVLMAAALWAFVAHLDQGVEYARSLGMATVIGGSLLLVWAERAGDRPLLSVPLPRTARFWLVWGGVALSLPLFMYLPAIAAVFQIVPIHPSDWGLVLAVCAAALAWRAIPLRARSRPSGAPAAKRR